MLFRSLRCGKCKHACTTHQPNANLLYSPRNKIIATSLLIEAYLYEEQTRRGLSKRHMDELADLGDHCTVCMRCLPPCPVKINFGDVTIKIRNFLSAQGYHRGNFAKKAGMEFLKLKTRPPSSSPAPCSWISALWRNVSPLTRHSPRRRTP